MNLQGSFWTSGLADAVGASSASSIDEVLDRDDCTLAAVLHDADLLQECKAINSRLLHYLCQADVIAQLVQHVVRAHHGGGGDDDGNDDEIACSYMSSEVFACELVALLDALFEHDAALAALFGVLDADAPLEPRQAGYFRKVLAALIQRKKEDLVEYISVHPNVLGGLVKHIGNTCILEVLIMLGWDDGSMSGSVDNKWLFEMKLVPQLVGKLAVCEDEHTRTNASHALVDMIVKSPPSMHSYLVDNLQTPSVLRALVQHTFDESGTSLACGLAVLTMLVQRELAMNSEFEGAELSWELSPVVDAVVKRLPALCSCLVSPRHIPAPMATSIGVLKEPLGEARLRVADLVAALLRSMSDQVLDAVAQSNIIPALLDLFFEHVWNNRLHSVVETIAAMTLMGPCTQLHASLLRQGRFVQRCIEAFERNDQQTQTRTGFRLGHLGHIVRICTMIESRVQMQLLDASLVHPDEATWKGFVGGRLADESSRCAVQLGGHRPSLSGAPSDTDAAINACANADEDFDGDANQVLPSFSAEFGEDGLGDDDAMFDYGDEEKFTSSFQADEWPPAVFDDDDGYAPAAFSVEFEGDNADADVVSNVTDTVVSEVNIETVEFSADAEELVVHSEVLVTSEQATAPAVLPAAPSDNTETEAQAQQESSHK